MSDFWHEYEDWAPEVFFIPLEEFGGPKIQGGIVTKNKVQVGGIIACHRRSNDMRYCAFGK